VGEVGHQRQYVYDNDICQPEFILDSPPVTHREEKQGHTEDKVVEPHVQQVVVGKKEPEQSEDGVSFFGTLEEVQEGNRQETDTECQHDLFANEGWEDVK